MNINHWLKATVLIASALPGFAPARAADTYAPPAADNVQRFVIRSDTQYPRTKDSSDDPKESLRLLIAQDEAIDNWRNRFSATVPIFLNGDVTEFGHGLEWGTMKARLAAMHPTYFGLGNHDYDNNVDDCANNGCARDSLDFLYEKIGVWDVDAKHVDFLRNRYTGSYSYSKTFGDITFIQLNNHYNYSVSFSTGIGTKTYYDITPSLRWLEGEMARANDNGKLIVINMHRPPGDSTYGTAADREKFYSLVKQYKALAIFQGHTHSAGKKASIGITPVFDSGASFMKTFLTAEADKEKNTFTTYLASDNQVADAPLDRIEIQQLPPEPKLSFKTQPDGKAIVAIIEYDNTPRDKTLSSLELSLNGGAFEQVRGGDNVFLHYDLRPETTYTYRMNIHTTDPNVADRTDSGTFTTPKLQQMPREFCVDYIDESILRLKWKHPEPNFLMPYYIQVEATEDGHPLWIIRSIAHDNRSTTQTIPFREKGRDPLAVRYNVYYWSAKEGTSPNAILEGKDLLKSGCQY